MAKKKNSETEEQKVSERQPSDYTLSVQEKTKLKYGRMVGLVYFIAAQEGREKPTSEDLAKAAEDCKVSVQTIKTACKMHDCEWDVVRKATVSENKTVWLPVIAAILRGETLEEAGRKGGISKQRASHIREAMIEAKVFEAAEEFVLRTALPELTSKK